MIPLPEPERFDEIGRLRMELDQLRALVATCSAHLTTIVRMPNAEHIADAHNRAVQLLREATDPPKEPT